MSRLPTPGSDDGTWGNILNDFLGVSHSADGSLLSIDPTKVSGTAVVNSDVRLANARTPLAHAASHALGGSDPLADTRFQQIAQFGRTGSLFVTAGQGRFTFPFATTIVGVIASVGTAPTGASILIDVDKNGTTIFTTQANRPSIAATTNSTSSAAIPDITSFSAGDYLSVDIDQIGSATAGADLTVQVLYLRTD